MATNQDQTRLRLKELIDELPEGDLHAVKRYIQFLHYLDDPVAVSLVEAPLDDEPLTDEDIAALEEAREEMKAGKLTSHDEVMRELGLWRGE